MRSTRGECRQNRTFPDGFVTGMEIGKPISMPLSCWWSVVDLCGAKEVVSDA